MVNLNLALRFDDLRQGKRVVVVRFQTFLRFWCASWWRGLMCQLLLEFLALGLQALFQFPHLAVVLLQHIRGLQQLFKSLLVENWVVFFFRHNLYCRS